MSSIQLDVMDAILARLRADPPLIPGDLTEKIRRDHRTAVTQELAPRIHLVIVEDEPGKPSGDCVRRTVRFDIMLYVRNDLGAEILDPIAVAVLKRLKSRQTGFTVYPHNAMVVPGRIRYDPEVADQDALRATMSFTFGYDTDEWSLEGRA